MRDYYKPLTPQLREKINSSIDSQINELLTCKRNSLVNVQIMSLNMLRNFIKGLPDGYLIPFSKDGGRV